MADATLELVIRATGDQALRTLEQIRRATGAVATTGAQAGRQGAVGMQQFAGAAGQLRTALLQVGAAIGVTLSVAAGVRGLIDVFRSGVQRVEDFRLTTLGIAAALVSLDKNTGPQNVAQRLQLATQYAEGLYDQILLIDAQFSGSADELLKLAREFINVGLILDLNNQKQAEAFRGLAEAIKTAAPGLNFALQANQALRAIVSGVRDEMDQVVRLLGLSGIEGDKLRARLHAAADATERTEILMEALHERTKGFVAAGAQMQNTLGAVLQTLSATWTILSRAAFTTVWRDMVMSLQEVNSLLRTMEGRLTPLGQEIATQIVAGWFRVKAAIRDAFGSLIGTDIPAQIRGIADALVFAVKAFGFLVDVVRTAWNVIRFLINLTPLRFWREMVQGAQMAIAIIRMVVSAVQELIRLAARPIEFVLRVTGLQQVLDAVAAARRATEQRLSAQFTGQPAIGPGARPFGADVIGRPLGSSLRLPRLEFATPEARLRIREEALLLPHERLPEKPFDPRLTGLKDKKDKDKASEIRRELAAAIELAELLAERMQLTPGELAARLQQVVERFRRIKELRVDILRLEQRIAELMEQETARQIKGIVADEEMRQQAATRLVEAAEAELEILEQRQAAGEDVTAAMVRQLTLLREAAAVEADRVRMVAGADVPRELEMRKRVLEAENKIRDALVAQSQKRLEILEQHKAAGADVTDQIVRELQAQRALVVDRAKQLAIERQIQQELDDRVDRIRQELDLRRQLGEDVLAQQLAATDQAIAQAGTNDARRLQVQVDRLQLLQREAERQTEIARILEEIARFQEARGRGTLDDVQRARTLMLERLREQARLAVDEIDKLRIAFEMLQVRAEIAATEAGRRLVDAVRFVTEELRSRTFDWVEAVRDAADNMERALSEGFFQVMQGNLEGISGMLEGILNSVRRMLADFLAREVTNFLSQQLGNLLGRAQAQPQGADMASQILGAVTQGAAAQQAMMAPVVAQQTAAATVLTSAGTLLSGAGAALSGAAAALTAAAATLQGASLSGLAPVAVGGLGFFQHGGIATTPTAGIFGEAGPEALVPLDQYDRMIQRQSDDRGMTVHLNIQAVDARSFADLLANDPGVLDRALMKAMKRNAYIGRLLGSNAR